MCAVHISIKKEKKRNCEAKVCNMSQNEACSPLVYIADKKRARIN